MHHDDDDGEAGGKERRTMLGLLHLPPRYTQTKETDTQTQTL